MTQGTLKKIQEYYQNKKSEAERVASENFAYARTSLDFKTVDDRLSAIEHDLAFAEIKNNINLCKILENEKKELLRKRSLILKDLHLSEDDLTPNYECKKCSDTGFIGKNKCDCFNKVQAKVSGSSLGVNIHTLPDFDTSENLPKLSLAYEKMKCFVEKFPNVKKRNVVFTGSTGTGKTHLASCVAKDVAKKGYNVIFLSSFNLNNVFINYHSLFNPERQAGMDALINCDLLVIDDIGAEQIIKNVTVGYLLDLINERNLNNLSTIITTNLSPEKLLLKYGERIYSRIFDKRNSAVMNFQGDDLRLKK